MAVISEILITLRIHLLEYLVWGSCMKLFAASVFLVSTVHQINKKTPKTFDLPA